LTSTTITARTSRWGSWPRRSIRLSSACPSWKRRGSYRSWVRTLHKVTSFRRGANGQIRFETEQIYKFDLPSTTTEAQPWLWSATEKWKNMGQKIFNTQCKKRGLW